MNYQYSEAEMREMIREEYEIVHRKACELYPSYALRGRPTLAFFTKGTTAGWAKYNAWTVEINLHLARQSWSMIKNTISHEIAHMAAFAQYREAKHGRIWKAVHRALGGTGERCYSAVKEGVKANRARQTYLHGYRLEGTDVIIWIGTNIHNKIQSGEHRIHTATRIKIYGRHWTGQKKAKE